MAILQRKPIENISTGDKDRLHGYLVNELPGGADRRVNWLEDMLTPIEAGTHKKIVNRIDVDGARGDVALEILTELLRAGGPTMERKWIGFFLRRFANSLIDVPSRDFVLGLFDRYQLDTEPSQPEPESHGLVAAVEAVIGEDTRRPFRLIERYARAGRAVLSLYAPGGLGTGFLIADNLVMTCNHVMTLDNTKAAEQDVLRDTIAKFNFQQEIDADRLASPVSVTPDRNGLFYAAPAPLDFCVFAIDRASAQADLDKLPLPFGPLSLLNSPPGKTVVAPRDRVVIIQHPGGDPKVISYMNNLVQYADESAIQYTTTTDKGSSGAPVLNEQAQVVAVHNKGGDLSLPNQRLPGQSGNTYLRNEGTTSAAILAELQEKSPEIHAKLKIV